MRSIGRLPTSTGRPSFIRPCSAFSSFASGGGGSGVGGSGRGRGRGGGSPPPGRIGVSPDEAEEPSGLPPSGLGHGRGKPVPSAPTLPSFSSWISDIMPPGGRGHPASPSQQEAGGARPLKPIFFRRDDVESPGPQPDKKTQFRVAPPAAGESGLPSSLASGLAGGGRGQPIRPPPGPAVGEEENRHLRQRRGGGAPARGRARGEPWRRTSSPAGMAGRGGPAEMGRGGRGRGFRGRGRGTRGGARGRRERGEWGQRFRDEDAENDVGDGLYLGDGTDGQKLTERIGEDNMNVIMEGFDEMSSRIEYEPEYLMEDFGTNPDIDEKPIMSLEEALEKAKPFLMAYEGIQSPEEWEEVVKETMEKAPYMEQLVDIYCGPERVTAKEQNEELERVASTLPENLPSSVKNFTNRALLSLKSNPGWGYDKKCQFMDKLVWEIKQDYGGKQAGPS
ncbi:hypothetical protein EJ110_NYTH28132 [Nymphaea thermarum]|nr:hypothetical protein EJ110_NYTH28132 [Nymphaea thermarum]